MNLFWNKKSIFHLTGIFLLFCSACNNDDIPTLDEAGVPIVVSFQTTTGVHYETEGTAGVNVYLSRSSTSDITLSITSSGTAIEGLDYTLASSTITIPAGTTVLEGGVTLNFINDGIFEEKTIVLQASSTNATIQNPETPTPIEMSIPVLRVDLNWSTSSNLDLIITDSNFNELATSDNDSFSPPETIGIRAGFGAGIYYIVAINREGEPTQPQFILTPLGVSLNGGSSAISISSQSTITAESGSNAVSFSFQVSGSNFALL